MLNRSKLYAFGLLLGVFVAGVAVGGAASAAWGDRPAGERREDGKRRRGYADRLQHDLGLTEAQRSSVDSLLADYQDDMEALWGETRPRMNAIRSAIRQGVATLLTADQRAAFDSLNARSDSARAARNGGRHGR